jgi:phosphosulfolactate synthase (CoM biosynthesis protein A)/nitrogen fixation protein
VSGDATAPGSTVSLFDNGSTTALGTALVQADGSWTDTVTLAAGANSIVAKDIDLAGNTGSSTAVVLTLETAVPTVTITTAGGDTNVASHTITGSVSGDATAPGSTVSLFDNGSTTALGTALVQADGSWTDTVTLAAGANSIVAKDIDLAGNTGSSTAVVLTLETAVPTVTITTAGGDTNVASHTITGSVSGDATAPGSTVSLFDNGSTTALGTALVQADGSWTDTVTLAAGANSIVAKDIDLAGNTGSSTAVVLTLETAVPTVTITSPALTTNQAAQTITGTGEAGTTVTLLDNNTALPTLPAVVTVDQTGHWTANVTLANGANSLTAQDTDLAGNTGTSTAVTFTLDTVVPTVAITSPALTTSQAAQTITGTGEAGTTVTLLDNNTALPTLPAVVTVDQTGHWTANVTLANGANSLTAQDTDLAGNTGTSTAVTFTLDTVVPTVAITTAGGDTNVASHTITGTVSGDVTAPGSTVSLYDNGGTTAIGTALVGDDGSWTATAVPLVAGANSIVAKDIDLAGNTGSSTALVLTLETAVPTVAITTAGGDTNVASHTITGTVSGDATAPGSTVSLYDNGGTSPRSAPRWCRLTAAGPRPLSRWWPAPTASWPRIPTWPAIPAAARRRWC